MEGLLIIIPNLLNNKNKILIKCMYNKIVFNLDL